MSHIQTHTVFATPQERPAHAAMALQHNLNLVIDTLENTAIKRVEIHSCFDQGLWHFMAFLWIEEDEEDEEAE